jgi:hypothetical protein
MCGLKMQVPGKSRIPGAPVAVVWMCAGCDKKLTSIAAMGNGDGTGKAED